MTVLWLILLLPSAAPAQVPDINLPESPDSGEAWLVTYGPGNIYWQKFGHNALWIRDPVLKIDHTFNFGFFDFSQPRFLLNFIQGRMLYYSVAQPYESEFRQYLAEARDIKVQKLDLLPDEYVNLRDHLLLQVQPENRNYRYDYYLDNCSTRIRDALDVATDGRFSQHYKALDAEQTFREHTRRSVAAEFWYYLGLEIALALPVDRKINAWEEMFLPQKVADAAAQFTTPRGPLAGPVQYVFHSASMAPAAEPPMVWWRYLGAGLILLLFFALLSKLAGPVMADGSALGWLLVTGTGGGLILFLWLATDHEAAGANVNILLLNPLFLAGLIPVLRRATAWLMLGGLIVAAAQLLLPHHQFNLDVLAILAPLNLACAWRLSGRSPDFQPWFSR